jgi:hypothetical protein
MRLQGYATDYFDVSKALVKVYDLKRRMIGRYFAHSVYPSRGYRYNDIL